MIDIPTGPTAKLRTQAAAEKLAKQLEKIGHLLKVNVKALITDGSQPVGYGIGPALEARDVIDVLQNKKNAPQDLRKRALVLAGTLLELSNMVEQGKGISEAEKVLNSGLAWKKFHDICNAQGGFKEPAMAPCRFNIISQTSGYIEAIDNRQLAKLAKLAGAPVDKCAGIYLKIKLGEKIVSGDCLMVVHAESPGELEYALDFYNSHSSMIKIRE